MVFVNDRPNHISAELNQTIFLLNFILGDRVCQMQQISGECSVPLNVWFGSAFAERV